MGEIKWETNLSIALESARGSNKLLFVFFIGSG